MTNSEAKQEAIEHMRCEHLLMTMDDIDHNNGWTRIEPDGSNLPTDRTVNYRYYPRNDRFNEVASCPGIKKYFEAGFISHFKPIEEDKPPIY